jgi:chromatin segregation and condensation protein Rec8/ScpA/Scc1 (kleisin family)
LELMKGSQVRAEQEDAFGEIWLYRGEAESK